MKFLLANGTASFKRFRKKYLPLSDREACSAPNIARSAQFAALSPTPAPVQDKKSDKRPKASVEAKCPKPTITRPVAGPRGKKNQTPRMMPAEYAQHLNDQVAEGSLPKMKWAKVLQGKTIFYCSTDYSLATERTRRKMEIVSL